LTIVLDLFDLKVVDWSYGRNMTDDLVVGAFNKVMRNRELDNDGLFHSDRGGQYTSNRFEHLLEELGIKHSYSKKGYPYNNASIESFNAILKKEKVNANNYETFDSAKLAIFEFIESWYKNQRIQSYLDYITPNEKYNNYIASHSI
jgi:transposase